MLTEEGTTRVSAPPAARTRARRVRRRFGCQDPRAQGVRQMAPGCQDPCQGGGNNFSRVLASPVTKETPSSTKLSVSGRERARSGLIESKEKS